MYNSDSYGCVGTDNSEASTDRLELHWKHCQQEIDIASSFESGS